ncbi:hypothetical protein N7539_000655 [Penicillium diatomitis]|uniref:Uncharacterized protein n=1 Tax=Penicillium diatomitis TaxID=2819901 RepID=A0A9W9XM83_9EURO|nr:uncharacterized protein N7539_000655 [Penicillium diatomitis]KAJ5495539.1 hypothetical protein N7539_000655 [Penicillium diatomitis]
MSHQSRWRGPSRQSSQRQPGNGNRHQGGGRGGNSSWNANVSAGNAHASAQDQHVPVRGFNAMEAKNVLKEGKHEFYCASRCCPTRETDSRPTFYKPSAKDIAAQKSSNSPWGSKPNLMANGKDFWLELRKQVTALQRGGSGSGSSGPPVGG